MVATRRMKARGSPHGPAPLVPGPYALGVVRPAKGVWACGEEHAAVRSLVQCLIGLTGFSGDSDRIRHRELSPDSVHRLESIRTGGPAATLLLLNNAS